MDRASAHRPASEHREPRQYRRAFGIAVALVCGLSSSLMAACATTPTGPGRSQAVAVIAARDSVDVRPTRALPRHQPRKNAQHHWSPSLKPPRPGAKQRPELPVQLASSGAVRKNTGHDAGGLPTGPDGLRAAGGSLRAAIAKRARQLGPCFLRARGVLKLHLTIGATGRVGRISTRGTAPASVVRCVRRRALRWTFGKLPSSVGHQLTLRSMGEAQ